jgi:tRNA1Val (adenine37-N6)-methyltransferase
VTPHEVNTPDITEGGLLSGKIRYRQFVSGHRSGFEPVLLAASIPARPGEHVLEAGTGAGAALLCLAQRVSGLTGVGVEIARSLADLANENFKINGLSGYSCLCSDIEQADFGAVFDHAMANPPWHGGTSTKSPDLRRALAHHAGAGAGPALLPNWVAALTRCLKPRGSLTLIVPAALHGDTVAALRQQKYGAIQLFPLWPRAGSPAKLVLIASRLGARGAGKVLPGLVLHDDAGITNAAQAILRDGKSTALAG